ALSRASAEGNTPAYYTTDETMYYFLENRRVTENFVDTSGAKITPPTGFTQGKKTAITSDAYTFKQAGTLPDTYTTGGKTYKFKGWYKGKTKTEPLKTTKAPSYGVTYDDNDDLNVVYEPVEMADFPAQTYQFGFIDESGQRVDATKVGLTYDSWFGEVLTGNVADWKTVSIEKGKIAPTKNNLKEIAYPAQAFEIVSGKSSQYSAANLTFTPPRYYEKMSIYNKNGTFNTDYPLFNVKNNNSPNLIVEDSAKLLSKWFELMKSDTQSFVFNKTAPAPADVTVPAYLREVVINPINTTTKSNYYTLDKPVYYYLTNRRVTENFVDTSGAKITPPTGFTQGKQTVINSDPYTFKQAGTLPDTYTTGGKTYKFKGWYKGKSILNTLTTTKAPSYQVTYDDNDDLNVVYEEEIPTASVTLTRPKEVIDTNTNVIWTTTITNTSKAPLQNLTLKKGPNWSAGLTIPTFMEVTPEGETTKSIPVNSTLWTDGVSLPNAVPIGKKVSVAFTTRATGKPNTVLKAEVVVFGGIKDSTVDNFVRIRPNDQEVVTPTTEGFISVPTFDFGQVGVAGSKQQHSLKQAADYYGNGTRNPYLRIKKTQPNWSLTAQLSQPKSATDSLPTATRLLLGAAPVSSFTNYNQPTELKNAVGTTSAISLTANNTATSIIANKQFTGSNVYQLDFTFNNVKLEVPANQGVKGQQYKAAVTWNLVTGP
ncbi:WxL domain-containing protein, partial [Enterococcus faecalis]|uniref:WxL domain-containing protein n=1 Tax=Enterococcus faecalis TaxID=1351 RepID=UPI0022E35BC4